MKCSNAIFRETSHILDKTDLEHSDIQGITEYINCSGDCSNL